MEIKKVGFVVIGGGIAGICAAIAAARSGVKTALVHDRPMPGGNAGSEVRMHICGASCHGQRKNARETGIIEEILLENKYRNPAHSYAEFDALLWEKTAFQENLELYLNTYAEAVHTENGVITSVEAVQTTTEKRFAFCAPLYMDCTGDGSVAYRAGAECMYGREPAERFGEPGAVASPDGVTMGDSIMFSAHDAGRPVPFKKPFWAYNFEESDLMKHTAEITSGYWWIETGGLNLHVIRDGELIRDELLKIVYGVWDHIKNKGDHGADNMVLDWVGAVAAKRESRRVFGDYILKEQDLLEGRIFDDAVAYGGWHIDSHQPERFKCIGTGTPHTEDVAVHLKDIYSIPYRCLYARDIKNLFLGGRVISASHRAFSSTRVMGTCAVMGQAAGTAAAIASERGLLPADVSAHIEELRQRLLRDGCYIPGAVNRDSGDLARRAAVSCSSSIAGGECENVTNGVARPEGEKTNCWISAPFSDSEEWIALKWEKPVGLNEIDLTFDSELSAEIMISLSAWIQERQSEDIPHTIARAFRAEALCAGKTVYVWEKQENHLRCRKLRTADAVFADEIRLYIPPYQDGRDARIQEIRVYGV